VGAIADPVAEPELSEETISHLREIVEVYGVHGAYYLDS